MSRQPPIRLTEEGHYAFLHEVGVCSLTGTLCDALDVEHLRQTDYLLGAGIVGMSQKSHFLRTIPLASRFHEDRHDMGQETFYRLHGWPMDSIVFGQLALAATLTGFSALQNVEGARNYLLKHAIMRKSAIRGLHGTQR